MRRYYKNVLRDQDGNVIPASEISVFLAGTATPANVYATLDGTVPVHKVDTDENGVVEFYVSSLDYGSSQKFKMTSDKDGFTSVTWDNVDVGSVVLGTYDVDDDVSVAHHLSIPEGVVLRPASGKTITIQSVSSGPYQIFDESEGGSVVVTEYPQDRKWWGEDQNLQMTNAEVGGVTVVTASPVSASYDMIMGIGGKWLRTTLAAAKTILGISSSIDVVVKAVDDDSDVYVGWLSSFPITAKLVGKVLTDMFLSSGNWENSLGATGQLDVMPYRERSTVQGGEDTQVTFVASASSTVRLSWDGVGTDPEFGSGGSLFEAGDTLFIISSNFDPLNYGLKTIDSAGVDYVEYTDASGVSQASVTVGSGGVLLATKFRAMLTAAVTLIAGQPDSRQFFPSPATPDTDYDDVAVGDKVWAVSTTTSSPAHMGLDMGLSFDDE